MNLWENIISQEEQLVIQVIDYFILEPTPMMNFDVLNKRIMGLYKLILGTGMRIFINMLFCKCNGNSRRFVPINFHRALEINQRPTTIWGVFIKINLLRMPWWLGFCLETQGSLPVVQVLGTTQKDFQPGKQQPMIYICGRMSHRKWNKIQGSNQVQRMWIQNNVQEKNQKIGGFWCSMKHGNSEECLPLYLDLTL